MSSTLTLLVSFVHLAKLCVRGQTLVRLGPAHQLLLCRSNGAVRMHLRSSFTSLQAPEALPPLLAARSFLRHMLGFRRARSQPAGHTFDL